MRHLRVVVLVGVALAAAACGFTPAATGDPDAMTVVSTISFEDDAGLQDESVGPITIPVTIDPAPTSAVTVAYKIVGVTATQGSDFSGTNGTLTFAPGETQQGVPLTIIQDAVEPETNETIEITLENPSSGALLGIAKHTVTISAVPLPRAFIMQDTSAGPESTSLSILIQLDHMSPTASHVELSYDGGTAGADDHGAVPATVTIPAMQTSVTLDIPITDDKLDEEDVEDLVVRLTGSPDVVIQSTQRQRTHGIQDNDAPPVMAFKLPTTDVTEGTTGQVEVQLLDAQNQPITSGRIVTVTAQVVNTTAVADDYTFGTATLTLQPGVAGGAFSIDALDDIIDEEDKETLALMLTNPDHATLGNTASTVVSIVDTDDLPAAAFANCGQSVAEGTVTGNTTSSTVTLTAASGRTVTVPIKIAQASDADSGDINPQPPSVVFAPGEVTKQFSITTVGDITVEGNEDLVLDFKSPINATIGTPSTCTIKITE